ncbi:MAG: T9SS type A sorting domain-containing protein [Ignavibacteria bacterium]|nr:T9SS type A sorting domain-containing protein [Ignavibacteria bacterium]
MKNIILFLFVSFSSLFAQQITFPQDTIARNNLFNNREFPAFDSNGKVHVSYTGQLDTDGSTREIYYAREESNGSFTTVNLTNNNVDDNYSSLSIDANDKLHVGYTGRDGSNLFQIKYLTNFSGSFGAPIEITQGGLNKATPYSKIGSDSVMHFVFFTYTDGSDFTYYRSYDLRTSTLSPIVTLAEAETGGDFDAALDVDKNDKVYIVVKSGGVFGGQLKYYNNLSGTLAELPTTAAGNITNPKVEVDKNNIVHIVYRNEGDLRLYYIDNQSGSFSQPLAITPMGQRPATYQNVVCDIFMKRGTLFDPMPVEFVAFSAEVDGSGVTLKWETATEKNNKAFKVERIKVKVESDRSSDNWQSIGFVNGNGTTTEKNNYSFIDKNLFQGKYKYRLKQIDNDGKYEYSKEIEVSVNNLPTEFALGQNYPNPFNPSTTIKYSVPYESSVKMIVFNTLGEIVKELVSEVKATGNYEVNFNASRLSSGIYFYSLTAQPLNGGESFRSVKKVVSVK